MPDTPGDETRANGGFPLIESLMAVAMAGVISGVVAWALRAGANKTPATSEASDHHSHCRGGALCPRRSR